jgi:hypothetical protein
MRTSVPVLAFLLAMFAALATASADKKFHPMPGGKGRLAVKVVAYDGATNGVLTVEVKNTRASRSGSRRGPVLRPRRRPRLTRRSASARSARCSWPTRRTITGRTPSRSPRARPRW